MSKHPGALSLSGCQEFGSFLNATTKSTLSCFLTAATDRAAMTMLHTRRMPAFLINCEGLAERV
jgi:hypothetical protein